jgi:hypothetical protein
MDEDYSTPSGEEFMEAAAPVTEVNEVPQEQSVPLSALQAERSQRQQLQQEMEMIRNHLSLMQSNQQQSPDDDGDIITKGDLKKMLQAKENEFNTRMSEIQIAHKYSDYEDIVTKYLPEVIKENPRLLNVLKDANDPELAYMLAKKSDAYIRDSRKTKKHDDAERILRNAASSGSLAAVGSNSPISQAKSYKTMSDEEFRQEMNKNLGQY